MTETHPNGPEPDALPSVFEFLYNRGWKIYLGIASIAFFLLISWSSDFEVRERDWKAFQKECSAVPSVAALRELLRGRGLFLGLKDGSWIAFLIGHTRRRRLPHGILLTHEGELFVTEHHLCSAFREFVVWKAVVADGIAQDSPAEWYSPEQLSLLGDHCPPRAPGSPLGSRIVSGEHWNEAHVVFSRRAPRSNPLFRLETAASFNAAKALWPELGLVPFGKLDNPRLLESATWVAERVGSSTPPALWTPEQEPSHTVRFAASTSPAIASGTHP